MQSNYPLGAANDPEAPYNKEIPEIVSNFTIRGSLYSDLKGEELFNRIADFRQELDNLFKYEDDVIIHDISCK